MDEELERHCRRFLRAVLDGRVVTLPGAVASSPDGCLVATAGSYDRTARVWAPPFPGCHP